MPVQTVDLKLPITSVAREVLAPNPNRSYAILINNGSDVIYLGMGIPAVVDRGIPLVAKGTNYEITLTNPFKGRIFAISSGTPDLLVQEW